MNLQPVKQDGRRSSWQILAWSATLAATMLLDAVLTFAAPQCRSSWMSLVVPLAGAPVAFTHLETGRAYQRSADRRLRILSGICAAGAVLAAVALPDPSAAVLPAGLAVHLLVIAALYHRRRLPAEGPPAHPPQRAARTRPEGT